METVTVKFEDTFLQEVEEVMKKHRYATKAEFIREAIREKLEHLEKKEAVKRALEFYGQGKMKGRKITDEKIHQVREKVVHELLKEMELE